MAMHCALFPMDLEKYVTEVLEESKRFGVPPIVIAARRGLSQLIQHFWCDPHCSLDDKKWAFYDAYKHSNLAAIKALARVGITHAAIDEKGNTILHWAAKNADPEFLRILVECYLIDINSRNKDGETPLMIAVALNKTEIVRYLSPLSPTLPSKRPLVILKLWPNLKTLTKIGKVARQWETLSLAKIKLLDKRKTDQSRAIFVSLGQTSNAIANWMNHPQDPFRTWNQLYICKDVALGKIQAIALVKSYKHRKMKIKLIVTNPCNVRSAVNQEEPTKVEGAASHLIFHLAAGLGNTIYLESVPSAVPFYEKLGFKEQPYYKTGFENIPMILENFAALR